MPFSLLLNMIEIFHKNFQSPYVIPFRSYSNTIHFLFDKFMLVYFLEFHTLFPKYYLIGNNKHFLKYNEHFLQIPKPEPTNNYRLPLRIS